MLDLPEEVWRPVPSRAPLEASSHGRIRVPSRPVKMPYGGVSFRATSPTFGGIMSASRDAKHVYWGWRMRHIGTVKVHRAVCEAFHGPAPFPRAVVIHINENALDNRPENLRWGTQKENLNMPRFIAYCRARTGANNPHIKGRMKRADRTLSPPTRDGAA